MLGLIVNTNVNTPVLFVVYLADLFSLIYIENYQFVN